MGAMWHLASYLGRNHTLFLPLSLLLLEMPGDISCMDDKWQFLALAEALKSSSTLLWSRFNEPMFWTRRRVWSLMAETLDVLLHE